MNGERRTHRVVAWSWLVVWATSSCTATSTGSDVHDKADASPNTGVGSDIDASSRIDASASEELLRDAGTTTNPGPDASHDAAALASCSPVQQRTSGSQVPEMGETPYSGLLLCDEQARPTFLVDELPSRCELIGEPWPGNDAGVGRSCGYDCSSGWCDIETNECLRISQCVEDSDCAAGEVCLCSAYPGWSYNRCLPAGCRANSECGDFACAVSQDLCQAAERVECHTDRDECRLNSDCEGPDPRCAYDVDVGAWRCAGFAICD